MELVSHVIPVKTRSKDEILVMPLGDVQWYGDADEIALSLLKDRIAWGMERGAYFLGMGDYIDTFSPSNRERLESVALYDTAKKGIDKMASDLVLEIYNKALKPTKGRWLGLLSGHHFHCYRGGMTTDQHLATLLDAPFLGTSAFVRLILKASTAKTACTIWCHHGVGGGKRLASPLNQLDQLPAHWEADIYLIGHHTKLVAAPMTRLELQWTKTGGRLVERKKIVACTGGFMKGYIAGIKDGEVPRGNYVEQKMLSPTSLGSLVVKILPKRTHTRASSPNNGPFHFDLAVEQ